MKLHATRFGLPSPKHAESEDAFFLTPGKNGSLLCVLSDGVGSARDPRRAADRVVRLISDHFNAHPSGWPIQKTLERLAGEAHASLCREGAYLDGVNSMQATLAVVSLQNNRLSGLNVGDSPVWLIREGQMERLSESHVHRNTDGREVLTHVLGMPDAFQTHGFERELKRGDRILISSDGLTHLLSDSEIGELVRKHASARGIVQEALQRSAIVDHDDLSAVLVAVEELSPVPSDPESANRPLPRLARGERVDGYLLLRSMADTDRVWLAEKEGRRVVMKFVPAEAESDDDGLIRARFYREAANASRFKDEYFVPASLPENGLGDYYLMDYLEAPSLRFFLKTRRLTVEEAVDLGVFLAKACQRLLRNELIHGDLKPENILIQATSSGATFKLLDLGIAAPVFTDSGTAGTASYLAPERFTGAVVTERTEIYAIGATLYEMLTGRMPQGAIERFQKPRFGAIRRPSHWNPNVPGWMDAVIMKCLNLDPAHRFQHYSELEFALNHPKAALAGAFVSEPLLTRNPLRFYQIGFWICFLLSLLLLLNLLARS